MRLIKRLSSFEKRLEKKPKKYLWSTVLFVFLISVAWGYLLGQKWNQLNQQLLEQELAEIRQLEKERMNKRIDLMREKRFVILY